MKRKPLPSPSLTQVWESFGGAVHGTGNWAKARCPIHDDNSASASVNEDAGKWSCFTCDLHGDVFDLIMEMLPDECPGFRDAVAFAEKFAGGSDGPVRAEPAPSGLLPRGSRRERNNGTFVPPWRRL